MTVGPAPWNAAGARLSLAPNGGSRDGLPLGARRGTVGADERNERVAGHYGGA